MEEDTLGLVERLDSDTAGRIFSYLDEPTDLARLATVSRSCHRMVVESRCFKDLCIKISPEVSRFNSVTEEDKMCISGGPSSSKGFEWTNLNMEHRVYGKLARELIEPLVEKKSYSIECSRLLFPEYPPKLPFPPCGEKRVTVERVSLRFSSRHQNCDFQMERYVCKRRSDGVPRKLTRAGGQVGKLSSRFSR